MRERTHFDVDVWPDLTPRANALLQVLSSVFVLVLALVFVWWGIEFVRFGWDQTSEISELPMWLIFIAWPLTFLLLVLRVPVAVALGLACLPMIVIEPRLSPMTLFNGCPRSRCSAWARHRCSAGCSRTTRFRARCSRA